MKRFVVFAATLLLLLLPAALAHAQFSVYETLIDETDAAASTASDARFESASNPHSAWYFKLKLTAISANAIRLYIQCYDTIDSEWDAWGAESTEISAPGEIVVVYFRDLDQGDATTLTADADSDIDKVYAFPLCWQWRAWVFHNGASTSSYTVTHWRY